MYHKLPSEIMRINDEYTAFCFDEACLQIQLAQSEKETKVVFIEDEVNKDGTRKTLQDMILPKLRG